MFVIPSSLSKVPITELISSHIDVIIPGEGAAAPEGNVSVKTELTQTELYVVAMLMNLL